MPLHTAQSSVPPHPHPRRPPPLHLSQRALLWHARSTAVTTQSGQPGAYEVAYALHVKGANYLSAAKAMFELAQVGAPSTDEDLPRMLLALGCEEWVIKEFIGDCCLWLAVICGLVWRWGGSCVGLWRLMNGVVWCVSLVVWWERSD